jgi:hypothetical protein
MGLRVDPSARFERERKRVKQEETARQQQVQEAIRRKFAAQGVSGGAEVKVLRESQDVGAQQQERRLEDVAGREETEALRRQEIGEARDFAQREREAQQEFARTESEIQRKFAAGETAAARKLQQEQFEKQLGFQQESFRENLAFQQSQLDTQVAQFNKQFKQQLIEFDFNAGMTRRQVAAAEKAAQLALEQFEFSKQTEAFNALSSVVNQMNKDLTPEAANMMMGILGPEIMGEFGKDLDFTKLFAPPPAPPPKAPFSPGVKNQAKDGQNVWGVNF